MRQTLIRNLPKVSKNVAIIQGDFNIHLSIWDKSCRSETGTAGVNLYTLIVEENFQLVNMDDEPTWYRENDIPRVLDLLFVNNNLGRQDIQDNFKLIGEKFDHRTMTLNLKQGRRVLLGHPYIKGESEEEFSFLQDILNDVPYWTCLANAQDKTSKLMEGITKAFNKYAKRPKINSKPTMWWTDACSECKEDYAQQPCKQTRMAYYKAIHKVKKEYFGKKIDEMCEQNKPWEGVQWMRDRLLSTIPRFANDKGKSITTMEELWPILDKQFNLGNKKISNIDWDMIQDLPAQQTREWFDISTFEIKEAIKTMSNSSAPGYSNISWRHLKILLREDEFINAIKTLFNDILNEGDWPKEFKIVNTVVIPKPKREDYLKPKNFQPIALLDCVGKLLSKVLAVHMQDEALKYDLLHPLQFGGIK
ncbi:hypothetical protein AX15_005918 [Amanita polypyramis BW_CC]|nr:hypothetical protein AX15_005918 [Amanita polypyramis BW_CC]